MITDKQWDVFISHAWEDKDFVRPLAVALNQLGVNVWYDEFALKLGDSLSGSIDKGLANCKYGLVIISPSFIGKAWPDYELRGLISREIGNEKIILPIWHNVTREVVISFSPNLADKLAFKTSDMTAEDMVIGIIKVVRPDIYDEHPRAKLQKIASGEALRELEAELEYIKSRVDECPFCGAELSEMVNIELDKHTDGTIKSYACGFSDGDMGSRPCPADPNYPKIEDYELITKYSDEYKEWTCYAKPKTKTARMITPSSMPGRTEEEAKQRVIDRFNWWPNEHRKRYPWAYKKQKET